MEIDEMLDRVAEQTRPPERAAALAAQIAREVTQRRVGWRARLGAFGVALGIIAVGGGGVAVAAEAGLLPWLDWTPDQETSHLIVLDDGSRWTCPIAVRVTSADPEDDSEATADQVREVRNYFGSLDLDRIVTAPEKLADAQARAEQRPDEVAQAAADTHMAAWSATVADLLMGYAEDRGFDRVAIESAGEKCEAAE